MKAINVLLGIFNIFLITEIYITTFQSLKRNVSTENTVLVTFVFFFLELVFNGGLLIIYYLMKNQALINFQRIIVLLVLISGSVGVCVFSQ
jgi:hypothetical protein